MTSAEDFCLKTFSADRTSLLLMVITLHWTKLILITVFGKNAHSLTLSMTFNERSFAKIKKMKFCTCEEKPDHSVKPISSLYFHKFSDIP